MLYLPNLVSALTLLGSLPDLSNTSLKLLCHVMLNTRKMHWMDPSVNDYKVAGKLWLVPVRSALRDKLNTNNTLIKSLFHTKHMKILAIGI